MCTSRAPPSLACRQSSSKAGLDRPSLHGSACRRRLPRRQKLSCTSAPASAHPSQDQSPARSSRLSPSCTPCSPRSSSPLRTRSWATPRRPAHSPFAATYPQEVAGLVYVDPTDFTQTDADMTAIWEKLGVKDGPEALRKSSEQMVAALPTGVRAEQREIDRVMRSGFTDSARLANLRTCRRSTPRREELAAAADRHVPRQLRPIFPDRPRAAPRSFRTPR